MEAQADEIITQEPVSLVNGQGSFPALIVCEHASNFIPQQYGDLGLSDDERISHIAWDPGADIVATKLSNLLNVPYVKGEISRLIYDCNRPPEAVDAMPSKSEATKIPGNMHIDDSERNARVSTVYEPFKDCIANVLVDRPHIKILITIHSFTPTFHGKKREVELGILHDEDTRLADSILEAAASHTSMNVQRNQPYGPQHAVMHTLKEHGISNGLLNVMFEIRNDRIACEIECQRVALELYDMLCEAFLQLGILPLRAGQKS